MHDAEVESIHLSIAIDAGQGGVAAVALGRLGHGGTAAQDPPPFWPRNSITTADALPAPYSTGFADTRRRVGQSSIGSTSRTRERGPTAPSARSAPRQSWRPRGLERVIMRVLGSHAGPLQAQAPWTSAWCCVGGPRTGPGPSHAKDPLPSHRCPKPSPPSPSTAAARSAGIPATSRALARSAANSRAAASRSSTAAEALA